MSQSFDLGRAYGRIHLYHTGHPPDDELRLGIEAQQTNAMGPGWVLFDRCTFTRAQWKEAVTLLVRKSESDSSLGECLAREEIGRGVMEALTTVQGWNIPKRSEGYPGGQPLGFQEYRVVLPLAGGGTFLLSIWEWLKIVASASEVWAGPSSHI